MVPSLEGGPLFEKSLQREIGTVQFCRCLVGIASTCLLSTQRSKVEELRERKRWNMSQQSTSSKDPLFETRDGIWRVTFNRPQARNALTFEMYELLAQGMHR